MADTVEEVYNQNLSATTLSSGPVTAVTTDANTRYVIRDIDMERPQVMVDADAFNMTAKINGVQIVDLTNGSAGGTSIMGPSSSLTLNTTSFPLSTSNYKNIKFHYPRASNLTGLGWVARNTYQLFNANNVVDADTGAETSNFATGVNYRFVYTPNNIIYAIYDDANSSQALYRRVPGEASQTTVSSGQNYAPVVWDNYLKFYQTYSSFNTLFTYDASTNTSSTMSITGAAGGFTQSSYPRAYFCNGFYWFVSGTSNTQIRAVNVSNGVSYLFTLPTNVDNTSDTRMSVGYVASEDRFYLNWIYSASNTHRSFRIDKKLSTWSATGESISEITNLFGSTSYSLGSGSPAYLPAVSYAWVYQFGTTCYWRPNLSPYQTIYKAEVGTRWDQSVNISTETTFDPTGIADSSGSQFYYQPYNPSAAEIASISYDYSSLATKVRITAVKSV